MKNILVRIVYVTTTLLVCSFGILLLMRNRAVLYAYHEAGDPLGEPAFVVLNPLRDRAPERVAQKFMAQLGSPQCKNLVQPLRHEYAAVVCSEEQKYPARRFHVANRQDKPHVTTLSYRIDRSGMPEKLPSRTQLELREDFGHWQITDFQPVY